MKSKAKQEKPFGFLTVSCEICDPLEASILPMPVSHGVPNVNSSSAWVSSLHFTCPGERKEADVRGRLADWYESLYIHSSQLLLEILEFLFLPKRVCVSSLLPLHLLPMFLCLCYSFFLAFLTSFSGIQCPTLPELLK